MKKVKSKLELFGECFLAEVGSYLGLEGWVGLWERKSKEEGLLDQWKGKTDLEVLVDF